MSTKNYLTVASLIVCLFAPTAYATNGYMSHGYGTTSKGMAGAGMAVWSKNSSVLRYQHLTIYGLCHNACVFCLK